MKINHKQIQRITLITASTLVVGFAVNILSPDAESKIKELFGEHHKVILLSLLVVFAVIVTILTTNAEKHPTAETPSTPPDESLQTEIRKYLKSRYEHRIRQKLAGREPVNLRKIPSSTGTSDEGAQNFMTLPAEKVPSGMAELFDDARGRLLVVGAPGAGKTTLLIQLALALLERPGKDLPVLLNLATWRSEFATFDDWLQRILPLELGASKALAEIIRRNTPLILLLDGLDEVPEDARASCLKAIGEYGAEAKHRFVISSRITEYAATQDAPVYLEVEVQPLTPQQVMDNLTAYVFHQPEAKPLLNALQTDPLLREAIANPFYLNTAQLLFATGRKYSDFGFKAKKIAGRQRELVERFVEDALGRKVGREYPKEKARKWLGFLAGKMEQGGKVGFELVDIKNNWVMGWGLWEIIIVVIFMLAIFCELIWIIGLFFLHQLTNTVFYSEGEHLEKVKWNFNKAIESLHLLIVLTILGGVGGASINIFNYLKTLILREEPLHSPFDGLLTGCLIGIPFGVIAFIASGFQKIPFIKLNSPYERLMSALLFFNLEFFKHLSVRVQLSNKSLLPLRLVTFLNEMSLRHLLEFDGDPETGKGGGAWRWRHRIIQEYFLEVRSEE